MSRTLIQIPSEATDAERFRVCFGITRMIALRDEPVFVRQLYEFQ